MEKQLNSVKEILSLRFDSRFRTYLDHRFAHKNNIPFVAGRMDVHQAKEWLSNIADTHDEEEGELSEIALKKIATVMSSYRKWLDSQTDN